MDTYIPYLEIYGDIYRQPKLNGHTYTFYLEKVTLWENCKTVLYEIF